MALDIYLGFVMATIVVVTLPGPTSLLVATQTIAHGRRATAPLLLGVMCGDGVAVFVCMFGIGALLLASALWFGAVKWIGAAYLIYLGVTTWRGARDVKVKVDVNADVDVDVDIDADADDAADKKPRAFFLHAFVVTAFNPKGLMFFIAFLPQFVTPEAGNVNLQLVILAVTFILLGSTNAFLYSFFAARVRGLLSDKIVRRRVDRIGGGALIGAGLWAATLQRA